MNRDFKQSPIIHTGKIVFAETTTPTPIANHAQIYPKNDNVFYYQDGAGTEHPISDVTNASTELNVLSSTFSAGPNRVLTGSIDPTASRHVVGVGTLFTTEVRVGDVLTVNGEQRVVEYITDNTHLSCEKAFTNTGNDTSPEIRSPQIYGGVQFNANTYSCTIRTLSILDTLRFNGTGTSNQNIDSNFYYDGAFRSFNTGFANRIQTQSTTGKFLFQSTAASVNEGDTVSLVTNLEIDADGSLIAPNISVGSGNAVNINATTGELYENTSSQQFKDNITDIVLGLDTILKLRPVNFTWNDKTANNGEPDIGLIAEEVDLVSKELVIYKKSYSEYNELDSADKSSIYQWCKEKQEIDEQPVYTESPYGVRYTQLTVVNSKAIQELYALIQSLEQRIATLEGKL